jgi:esterase/lipase
MAAPEEMRELGEHLHSQGYTVYGVRLRGHGTSPEDLASRRWEEWYDSVNRGYIILKHYCKKISLCGFSTGAGLALLQSARKGSRVHSVISISAPLRLQDIRSRFASAITIWNDVLKRFNVNKGSMEFVENHPENPHINYHQNPVHGIHELEKLMKTVEKELADVRIPTLVIQASDDPVVHPESAMTVFSSVGTAHRELFKIYSQKHGIVRGSTSAPLARRISLFLEEQKREE